MNRRPLAAPLSLALLVVGASLATTERAWAEPARSFTLASSPRCALRSGFEDEVARLTGSAPAPSGPERLSVRLRDVRRGVRVELRVERAQGASLRALTLESCAAANDAAVLLAALAIDPSVKLPEAAAVPVSPPAEGDAPTAPVPPASAPEPLTQPGTGASALSGPAPAASKLPADAAPSSSSPSADARAAPATAEPDQRDEAEAASAARATGRAFHAPVLVRVAGALDPSQLDGASGALLGELGTSVARWELALGARYTLAHALDALPNGADVSLSSGHASGRVGFRFVRGALALIPAASLGVGALRVDADTVSDPGVKRVLIADLGLGAQLEWALAAHFAVDLGAELVLPLRRPALALDGQKVFELPAVAGRIALGLRFWTLLPKP